jgi:hypothetical protein
VIHHITYSNADMSISAQKCCESALKMGADRTTLYCPTDIDAQFKSAHESILSEPRGAGYWLWKPYIVEKTISTLSDGEYLVYTDAGVLILNQLSNLIDAMDSDIMVFGNRWRHGDWCRMDVLEAMGCQHHTDREQLQASCIVLRKSETSEQFASQWLYYCTQNRWITDDPSELPNEATFREHRHDQAILTNVALQYGLTWHWWPAQYSEQYRRKYTNDRYPQMFEHHRKRNNEW